MALEYTIIKEEKITRSFVRSHPDWIFLFGDNIAQLGSAGQAAEMRGEPNAIGVPTKMAPHMFNNAFMSDMNYSFNVERISLAFAKIPKPPVTICISTAGLGTGLAQLDKRAPSTFKFLQDCLHYLGAL